MTRRQREKDVLLSGEYKSQEMTRPIDTRATLMPEFVRQLP